MVHLVLTEKQLDILTSSANANKAFIVPEPCANSDMATQLTARDNLYTMGYLVEAGMLTDMSNQAAEDIEKFKDKYGHGFKLFMLTELGLNMFTKDLKGKLN